MARTGQGEAQGGSQCQHYCRKRYEFAVSAFKVSPLTQHGQPWQMPSELYVPPPSAGKRRRLIFAQSLGPKGMDKMV